MQTRSLEVSSSFPDAQADLFANGILDSFALASLISLLEQEFGIKIPDHDVDTLNFQSIEAIEHYVASHTDR